MATLSNIITPSNILTSNSASTLINKTINGANNTLTNISLSTSVTGTLPTSSGGTGQVSFANGEILVGNTSGNTLTKTTLTSGTGISITNGAGSITITNTASPTPDYVIQSYGIV